MRVNGLLLLIAFVLALPSGVILGQDARANDTPKTSDELLEHFLKGAPRREVSRPFDSRFSPAELPVKPGPVAFRLWVLPYLCDDVSVTITEANNVEYIGPETWSLRKQVGDTLIATLQFSIPPDDTSSIFVRVACGTWDYVHSAYFVATKDSVSHTVYDPRHWPPSRRAITEPSSDYSHIPRESTGLDSGRMWKGFLDDSGNVISEDSFRVIENREREKATLLPPNAPDRSKVYFSDGKGGELLLVDTAWLFDSLRQVEIQAQWAELRRREQYPCTTTGERLRVGGEAWQRFEGQYEFHKAPSLADSKGDTRAIPDSLRSLAVDAAYHLSLDLRKREDYELAAQYADTLYPMERVGFYHARMTREDVARIERSGVSYGLFPHYPDEIPPMPEKKDGDSTDLRRD